MSWKSLLGPSGVAAGGAERGNSRCDAAMAVSGVAAGQSGGTAGSTYMTMRITQRMSLACGSSAEGFRSTPMAAQAHATTLGNNDNVFLRFETVLHALQPADIGTALRFLI